MKRRVKKTLMLLFLFLLGGYLLLLKNCIKIDSDIEKMELIAQNSDFLPQEEYYFITKKYLFSELSMNFMTGNGMIEIPTFAYGVNDQHNKTILKPFSTDFLKLVKISEMDDEGKIHEEVVWWSNGRVRANYYLPFLENKYKNEFFTKEGKKYKNKNKNFCIVKDTYDANLIDLKTRESIFYAYDMYWESPTEIIYSPADLGQFSQKTPAAPYLKMKPQQANPTKKPEHR